MSCGKPLSAHMLFRCDCDTYVQVIARLYFDMIEVSKIALIVVAKFRLMGDEPSTLKSL